jgi:zinc protease
MIAPVLLAVAVAVAGAKGPDRSKPPALGDVPKFAVPVPQRAQLKSGVPVLFVKKAGAGLVDVVVAIKAGAAVDPAGKPGVADWTAALAMQGAGDKGALALADAIDFLGARIAVSSSWDATFASLHVPSARFEPAAALLADVVLRPRFEAAEWKRVKDERLAGFVEARDDPRSLSGIAAAKALYGDQHRYGRPMMGTAASLAATTVDDLKKFHQAQWLGGDAVIVVVGDVEQAQALAILERAFAAWTPAPAAAAAALPAVAPIARREIFLVDKPGAPQSVFAIVKTTAVPVTAYDPPVQVMNTLLGGSFTSRLNDNLRERNGYAYGAGSSFSVTRDVDSFGVRTSVATPATAPALKEILFELDRIRAQPTADEAERARRYLALGFPSEFETGASIAAVWAGAEVQGVPAAKIESFMSDATRVGPADIAAAAKAHVDPERVRVVVVGDRAQIEGPLRELGVGPITVWSIDDVLPPPGK